MEWGVEPHYIFVNLMAQLMGQHGFNFIVGKVFYQRIA
jgi:hypothetical protein